MNNVTNCGYVTTLIHSGAHTSLSKLSSQPAECNKMFHLSASEAKLRKGEFALMLLPEFNCWQQMRREHLSNLRSRDIILLIYRDLSSSYALLWLPATH